MGDDFLVKRHMHELKITSIWFDDDVFEALIEASNDSFCGKVEIILPDLKCAELVRELDEFPKTLTHEVIFFSGDDLLNSTLGLKFYCRDSLGNASISISMRKDSTQGVRRESSEAVIVIHCDPVSIQNFRSELNGLLSGRTKTAVLRSN
jgi:hypothetical protein